MESYILEIYAPDGQFLFFNNLDKALDLLRSCAETK